jgi:hypothetical protein
MEFPDESVLEGLTGYHCLSWRKGRISAFDCSNLNRHPNLKEEQDIRPWRRTPDLRERQADNPNDRDAATEKHYSDVRAALSELTESGYYPKLVEVIPPIGRSALAEFQWSRQWYCGLEGVASKRLSSSLNLADGHGFQHMFEIRELWDEVRTTKHLNLALNETEALVRRSVREIRNDLWDGYLQSARVAALMRSIGQSQRERLIDRFKQ